MGLLRVLGIRGIYDRLTAEKMRLSYLMDEEASILFTKGIAYGVLTDQTSPIPLNTMIKGTFLIATLLLGRMNERQDWVSYALAILQPFYEKNGETDRKYLSQFPMMEFIFDPKPSAEKAHEFMRAAYDIDSRNDAAAAYQALVADHIKYTRLFKDVYTSVYASTPLNFLPLEILYLSLFIELPLETELMCLREALCNLPDVNDEGLEALVAYRDKLPA